MPSEGTPSKEPVVSEIGGNVEAPPHPPMSRWERISIDLLLPGVIAVVALSIPAAALVVIGKLFGVATVVLWRRRR